MTEVRSTARKLGLEHPNGVCICRDSAVWQQLPETHCLDHLWPRKHTWKPITLQVSSISLPWLFSVLSCMERTHHWDRLAWFLGFPRCRIIRSAAHSFHVSVERNLQSQKGFHLKPSWELTECSNHQTYKAILPQLEKLDFFYWTPGTELTVGQWDKGCCSTAVLCMQDIERNMRTGTLRGVLAKRRKGQDNRWSLGCLREKNATYRTCILASPQKAPSVNLLMLLRWSFRTSKLSSPWNVRPSIRRMRFRFSSLKSPRPYKYIKSQPFLTKSSAQHTMGTAMPTTPPSTFPRESRSAPETFNPRASQGSQLGVIS